MKKDSTIQSLLIISIAVVYPLVIFFAVYALLPSSSFSNRDQDTMWLSRGAIALILSILTTVTAVLSLRSIHEVFRGIVSGAVLTTIIAIIIIASVGSDSPDGVDLKAVRVMLLLFSFLFLTGLMYAAEQLIDVHEGPVLVQQNRPQAAVPDHGKPEPSQNAPADKHHQPPEAPPASQA